MKIVLKSLEMAAITLAFLALLPLVILAAIATVWLVIIAYALSLAGLIASKAAVIMEKICGKAVCLFASCKRKWSI